MIEADEKRKSERRNPQNEGKELSGIGGVFSGVSLQDVFSDSAGSSGLILKTICRPVPDGGNDAQLGVPGKKRKRRVGRKTMSGEQKLTRKLQLHLTEAEYDHLRQRQQTLGRQSMADYLRELILARKAGNAEINSIALISSIDHIGREIAGITAQIQAIALKMENQAIQAVDQQVLQQYNTLMEQYLKERRDLANAYRALIRGMKIN
jgi:hypothetical protein